MSFTKNESISKSSNSTTQINKGCGKYVVFTSAVTNAIQEENEINGKGLNVHKECEECKREV
jgi:hypothetical protein